MLCPSVWIVEVEKIIKRNNFKNSSKIITYDFFDFFFGIFINKWKRFFLDKGLVIYVETCLWPICEGIPWIVTTL